MSKGQKLEKLRALARRRRAAAPPEGYFNLCDFHDGYYECEWVSPWTKSARNVDAAVLLTAQDWASSDYLNGPRDPAVRKLGHDSDLCTNRNLHRLLRNYLGIEFSDVFATNLFPFIKPGKMGAQIKPPRLMIEAALEYAIPQVEVISPKLVICLGLSTYNAMRQGWGSKPIRPMGKAIAEPFTVAHTRVAAVAHNGRWGTNNRNRGCERVEADWANLVAFLN